jgi:YVTN family beta-propeller protein
MPGFAAFHSDTKELWVTDPMNGKVHWWSYDTSMKMFMKGGSLLTASGAHAIAFNNMTAYITNQESASLSIIDVKTHTKMKDLAVGQKPNGITLKL